MPPPEFNKEIRISIGFVVMIASLSFTLGSIWTRVSDLNELIIQEVGGLRSDWEREMKMQHERNKKYEQALDDLKETP